MFRELTKGGEQSELAKEISKALKESGPMKLRLEVCHEFRGLDTGFGLDVCLDFRKNSPKSSKCLSQIPGFSDMVE